MSNRVTTKCKTYNKQYACSSYRVLYLVKLTMPTKKDLVHMALLPYFCNMYKQVTWSPRNLENEGHVISDYKLMYTTGKACGRNPFPALFQFRPLMLKQPSSCSTQVLHFVGSPQNLEPFWDGDEDAWSNLTAGCGGDLVVAVVGGLPLEESLGVFFGTVNASGLSLGLFSVVQRHATFLSYLGEPERVPH